MNIILVRSLLAARWYVNYALMYNISCQILWLSQHSAMSWR